MIFEEKAYTYSMTVVGIKDHFTETITVEHPGEPTHNCPTMVSEGSSVTCRCNSSKAGNPPATTVWDGVKNETLHIENIQRQTQTNVYTCRVVWGSNGWINRSTLHTFDIAYGPSSVRIDYIIDDTGNERDMLRLMCTAVDVHPSAIFRWNITCDTQTHYSNTSTCAFSTANLSPETVVTCTASNNFSSDMSSYSFIVVNGTGFKGKN
ncbi:hypothetical protein C0Q70_12849 [Pomacea canaliculata]|uniref:Ig-like domain-containing protein n=1 Tax=Pomacea canaliculata TaxID=400727 RepID=A0A2T7P2N5_POMCA|nr:hypothetical protein C0Q70_12849 [Pomacea canaliculata]